MSVSATDKLLTKLYFDPASPAGFSGAQKLYKEARRHRKSLRLADVRKWLSGNENASAFAPPRIRFRRRKIIAYGIDHYWQADLADVSEFARWNKGVHFILVVVDVFSGFVFAAPVHRKTGPKTADAFAGILKNSGRRPIFLQTDLGTEFWNKNFRETVENFGVLSHFAARQRVKAAMAERAIRTLKRKLNKLIAWRGGARKAWLRDLPALVKGMNSARTARLGWRAAPKDVNVDNQLKFFNIIYPNYYSTDFGAYFDWGKRRRRNFMLEIGDRVKIAKMYDKHFYKGYRESYSKEIYRVSAIVPRSPPMYRLRSEETGDEIDGTWVG